MIVVSLGDEVSHCIGSELPCSGIVDTNNGRGATHRRSTD